jgi:hypothetical protein
MLASSAPIKGLARASLQELRQFLPRRSAEAVVAALSMSAMAETERARAEQLDLQGHPRFRELLEQGAWSCMAGPF